MNKRFAFVGMPGSGKSTTGACFAKKLGVPFFDLDELIVQVTGMRVSDFFQMKGEMAFREVEHSVLQHHLASCVGSWVLACGGGTPCFFNNMELLNAHCGTIYLDVEPQILAERLQERDNHTIFNENNGTHPIDFLSQIRAKRAPFYRQSALILGQKELDSPYLFTKRLYLFTKAQGT